MKRGREYSNTWNIVWRQVFPFIPASIPVRFYFQLLPAVVDLAGNQAEVSRGLASKFFTIAASQRRA